MIEERIFASITYLIKFSLSAPTATVIKSLKLICFLRNWNILKLKTNIDVIYKCAYLATPVDDTAHPVSTRQWPLVIVREFKYMYEPGAIPKKKKLKYAMLNANENIRKLLYYLHILFNTISNLIVIVI